MKIKKLFLFLCISICTNVYADDVIFTTAKQQIFCTITEISDAQVSYTRSDTPSITRHIATENVWKIVYGNGIVEEVNSQTTQQPVQQQAVQQTQSVGAQPILQPIHSVQYAKFDADATEKQTKPLSKRQIRRLLRVEVSASEVYPSVNDVEIIQVGQQLPPNIKRIGSISVGDSGFTKTENCTYEACIQAITCKAKEIGADIVFILSIKAPDYRSSITLGTGITGFGLGMRPTTMTGVSISGTTCYAIEAEFYKYK